MKINLNLDKVIARTENVKVCFTGHRPKDLHGYEKDKYYPIVDVLQGVCEELSREGASTFISGGAQGIDQLAFWAVDRMRGAGFRVDNEIYVPFRSQPNRWKSEGLFSQAEYRYALGQATRVNILANDPDPNDIRGVTRLLHARNHAMVNDSDVVVAFVSGETLETGYRKSKGGTAECMRYAVSQGKPVLTIEYRPGSETPFTLRWILK